MGLSAGQQPQTHIKITQCWFKKIWRTVLEWRVMSPDLNPINNLWRYLKTAVGRRQPKNIEELEPFEVEERAKLPIERSCKLIDGYKKHVLAVLGQGLCNRVLAQGCQ